MSKLSDDIGTFQTGDLVFQRYPPQGTQPIHVTVFLGTGSGVTVPSYVHAGDELEIAPASTYVDSREQGGYLHAHAASAGLRARLAAVAAQFASTAKKTPYGDFPGKAHVTLPTGQSIGANRFSGMIKTTDVAQIPFEFPALRRLLKWTYKEATNAPLSEHRGFTCAAFAAACVQVAGMSTFMEAGSIYHLPKKFKLALDALDELTETKDALRKDKLAPLPGITKHDGKPIYQGQALRENSNRKLTTAGAVKLKDQEAHVDTDSLDPLVTKWLARNGDHALAGIERLWLIVQTQYLEIPAVSAKLLQQIVPPGFLFDAKYVSSPALSKHLVGLKNWKTTAYTTY